MQNSFRYAHTKSLEEPVTSLSKQKQIKLKEFREFLVDKQVLLGMVKFLLALRSSEQLPENPIDALKDYFGEFRSPEWDNVNKLEEDVKGIREENDKLKSLIEDLERQKQELIEEQERKEEEERQRQLEEEQNKNKKKGGKK